MSWIIQTLQHMINKSILNFLLFKPPTEWFTVFLEVTCQTTSAPNSKSRDLCYVTTGTITVFWRQKRSPGTELLECDIVTRANTCLTPSTASGYVITITKNNNKNLNRRRGRRRSDVFRILKPVLTSRRSKLTKLAIANPSIISSSWELDSRLFLRGGRGVLLEEVERGGAFLPGLRSRSEPDEGLRFWTSPARTSRFRPLSRCERDLRLCFTFPSILKSVRCPPPAPPPQKNKIKWHSITSKPIDSTQSIKHTHRYWSL